MSSNRLEHIFNITLPALFCIILLCNYCSAIKDALPAEPNTIHINVNTTTKINFNRYNVNLGTTKILIKNFPQNNGFFLIQVHSFAQKVTLTNGTNFNLQSTVYGNNIGLVKILLPTDATKTFPFYLQAEQKGMVLIAVTVYGSDDPIPGGCSMTFNTDISPYLNLTFTNALIEVNYQDASIFGHYCEDSAVRLEMYRLYVQPNKINEDTYFNNIETMLTVEDIQKNGENITEIGERIQNLRKYISGYMGLGQIIVIVAVSGNTSSAYVPALTYFCNTTCGNESCYDYNVAWWGFLNTAMLIFGIALIIAEDWSGMKTNMILSLGISTYVFYTILIYTSNISLLAMVFTIIGFILAYYIIFRCIFSFVETDSNMENRNPIYTNFIISLICGLYVGTLIVTGGLMDTYNPSIFWCVFVLISTITCLFIFGLCVVNPFGYNWMAIVLITMSYSYFTGGTMHHIVTEVIRYMTVAHYDIAVKINLHNLYMIICGIAIALLRSIIVKAEGRPSIVVKLYRIRVQHAEYMQI